MTSLDVVVPVYNEAAGIGRFHAELQAVLERIPLHITVYYVDDGSTDGTGAELARIGVEGPGVVVIELSRNFGHQAALTAGLDATTADVVVMLDGDGQHPPELIPEMLRLHHAGYDVVLTQRCRPATPRLKQRAATVFYRILRAISRTDVLENSADFRLLARPVVASLSSLRETHRFLRGMVGWLGFRTVVLPYEERPRLAGSSKYSISAMLGFARDAVFSFSLVPLYATLALGVLFLCLAAFEAVYVLQFWLRGKVHALAPGWSSLMLVLLVVGGTLMICVGVVGLYVGCIFHEVKRRPIYVTRSVQGSPDRRRDHP